MSEWAAFIIGFTLGEVVILLAWRIALTLYGRD